MRMEKSFSNENFVLTIRSVLLPNYNVIIVVFFIFSLSVTIKKFLMKVKGKLTDNFLLNILKTNRTTKMQVMFDLKVFAASRLSI